jgi:hypothetical protein
MEPVEYQLEMSGWIARILLKLMEKGLSFIVVWEESLMRFPFSHDGSGTFVKSTFCWTSDRKSNMYLGNQKYGRLRLRHYPTGGRWWLG